VGIEKGDFDYRNSAPRATATRAFAATERCLSARISSVLLPLLPRLSSSRGTPRDRHAGMLLLLLLLLLLPPPPPPPPPPLLLLLLLLVLFELLNGASQCMVWHELAVLQRGVRLRRRAMRPKPPAVQCSTSASSNDSTSWSWSDSRGGVAYSGGSGSRSSAARNGDGRTASGCLSIWLFGSLAGWQSRTVL
jgi:hypothetical protein